jgi:hypothetical protein
MINNVGPRYLLAYVHKKFASTLCRRAFFREAFAKFRVNLVGNPKSDPAIRLKMRALLL